MSEIRATTISDAAGTGPITLTGQSAAKAWVNFNGTGTIAARDSFNVSSLTDVANGRYDVNTTNSFSSANYSASGISQDTGYGDGIVIDSAVAPTASSFQFYNITYTSSVADNARLLLNMHGDLA